PVPALPETRFQRPNFAIVSIVLSASGRKPGDMFPIALVRPARKRHRFTGVKELAMRRRGGAGESTRFHLPEVPDTQQIHVKLPYMGTSAFGQASEPIRIGDRHKSRKRTAAEQTDALPLGTLPDDK